MGSSLKNMQAIGFKSPHEKKVRSLASLLLLGLAGLLLPMSPVDAASSPPAMTVAGETNVSATGAFTYSIPVVVPPGTAGMQPAISLDYSSQNGDGPEGIGWILAGLPTITRCPRTLSQDGVHGGVNYDMNDRYCMNGKRLVAISGTYGVAGTEYRTEVESFSKITSSGTAGNGPYSFQVKTKNGQILNFGGTSDSAMTALGKTTVRVWALHQITDTKGNYLTITYLNDQTNGQGYPTRIDYTANATAGLAAFASVQFTYDTTGRVDRVPAYQAGSVMTTTVLLTHISTYYGTTLVSDYVLGYNHAASGATHDELASVKRCSDAADTNCLAPTTFGWQGGAILPSMSTVAYPSLLGAWYLTGDFNGDGLTDLLQTYNLLTPACSSGGPLYLGSNSGTYSSIAPTVHNYVSGTTGPFCPSGDFLNAPSYGIDLSGDRITDAWVLKNAFSSILVSDAISIGGNFDSHSTTNTPPQPPGPGVLADFDGDGLPDLVENTFFWKGNGDGTFTAGPNTLGSVTADFDGDGCADGVSYSGTTTTILHYLCSPAASSYSTTAFAIADIPSFVFGDFNGDGKTDIVGSSEMFLSTGTGLTSPVTTPTGWGVYQGTHIYTGDFNGDGKTDILAPTATGQYGVYISTGTGFVLQSTISIPGVAIILIADLNGDGASDILAASSTSGATEYTFAYTPQLMTTINNGIGGTTKVTYDRISKNQPLYTKCPSTPSTYVCGSTYPHQWMDGPIYVVSRIDASNGLGTCTPPSTNCYSTTYTYGGAQNDGWGRSFLGFSQVSATNQQTQVVHTTNYFIDFPLTGLISSETTVAPRIGGTVMLNSTVTTAADQISLGTGTDGVARYFVAIKTSVSTNNDANFATGAVYGLPTITTTNTYDCDSGSPSICAGTSPTGFGNLTHSVVALSDGSSKTTTNTYTNDATHWLLGRLTQATVQSIVPGTTTLTRTSGATYDMTGTTPSGLVTSETVEPTSTNNLYEKTAYGYDAFGNKTSVILSSYSNNYGAARPTTTAYDTSSYHGQFPTQITNALSQPVSFGYNSGFGVPTSHTDLNGLITSWGYDTFGRNTLETRPDGNKTAIGYAFCSGVNGGSATCPTYGAFVVTATPENSGGGQNGPVTSTYYDALSRVIATDTQGFDGSTIRVASQYNTSGNVAETSRPYFLSANNPKWTTFSYDPLNRQTLATFPDSSTTTNTYCGLTTSVTNGLGQIKTTVRNAQNLIASVVEAVSSGVCGTTGNATAYLYDAFGGLTKVTDPASNQSSSTYDLRGRKLTLVDPDMGSWSYGYNAFSDLTSQTDAKSQSTTLVYDLLARLTQRVEVGLTSNWVYDTAAHGVGSLASACTGPGCTTPANSTYFRAYTYDSLSRPSTVTLTIGGANYPYTTTYNSNGHIDTVTYPSSFVAKDVYTSLGYPSQIKDNASGTAYWTANTRDAELHLTKGTAGNSVITTQQFDPATGLIQWTKVGTASVPASLDTYNYAFDVIGNLKNRQDVVEGYTEYFCYDGLNRLTSNGFTSPGNCPQSAKTVVYDSIGNITSKSDTGIYTYGAGAAGPHAVSSITGTVNGVVNPVFAYDANGNQTCEYTGASCTSPNIARSIAYTGFNMASQIVEGATTIGLTYDSEHARITQAVSGSDTTIYLNDPTSGAMSEHYLSSGGWRDYIIADGHIVAQRSFTPSTTPPVWGNATTTQWGGFTWTASSSTPQVLYFTLDHLGSVTLITDGSGAVTEQDSYDAWGKRRNPDGSDAASCTIANATTRGFTNQEMMDEICAVNLNARIYDPVIGRFMAADSVVPDTYSLQTLNRYAYVTNNPLSFTDPTGHDCTSCSEFKSDIVAQETPNDVSGTTDVVSEKTITVRFIFVGAPTTGAADSGPSPTGIGNGSGNTGQSSSQPSTSYASQLGLLPPALLVLDKNEISATVIVDLNAGNEANSFDNSSLAHGGDLSAQSGPATNDTNGGLTYSDTGSTGFIPISAQSPGGITIDLPNRKWQVHFSSSAMQHVLDRHGYGRPDQAAGEYNKELSNPAMQLGIAALTINFGTIIGPGNAPNSVMLQYDFPDTIGMTGNYGGVVSLPTFTNTIVLQSTRPNSYNVLTQYPTR